MDAPLARFPTRGIRPTFHGIIFLLVSLLIGLAAMNARRNLLLVIFGVLMGAVVLSGLLGSLRTLEIRRWVPDSVMAGRRFAIRYQIRNMSHWRRVYGIHLIELLDRSWVVGRPEGMAICIGPQQTATVTVPVVCAKRGRLGLGPLRVASSFPFGLLLKYATVSIAQEVVVLPAVGRLKSEVVPAEGSDPQAGGGTSGRAGGLDEFFGVRDHRPGDNPRWIHWRRSARTGQLVVREMQQPRPRRLSVVLDTQCLGDGPADRDRLEYTISLAATLVCWGIDRGLQIGLLCTGPSMVAIPPAAGRRQSEPLLRELALLPENRHVELSEAIASSRFPSEWRGRCMLLTARPAEQAARAQAHLSRLVGPTVVWSVADGPLEQLFEPPLITAPQGVAGPPVRRNKRRRDGKRRERRVGQSAA